MLRCKHPSQSSFCLHLQFELTVDCSGFRDIQFAGQIKFMTFSKFVFVLQVLLFLFLDSFSLFYVCLLLQGNMFYLKAWEPLWMSL